jgi:hypothetical protein
VVQLDYPDLVVLANPAKRPDEVPRLDGLAAAGGEHETGRLGVHCGQAGMILRRAAERCCSGRDRSTSFSPVIAGGDPRTKDPTAKPLAPYDYRRP